MVSANQLSPGMIIEMEQVVYRVESAVKVSVSKTSPFMKIKLRGIHDDQLVEKNVKLVQNVNEVTLEEHLLEYLYPEKSGYLFLDIDTLSQVLVPKKILTDKILYLKEGIQVKALFYGTSIFSVDLPQFLELMVVNIENKADDAISVAQTNKKAVLESGAKIEVPMFIEVGDIVKVDTISGQCIQRV